MFTVLQHMHSHSVRAFSFVFLFCLLSILARAQSNSGTIGGTITDSTGAVLPGSTVTVTSKATNETHISISNNEGLYVIPFLQPGYYSVTVERKGFSSARQSDILLQVGDKLAINLTLQVGATSSAIEVKATTPLVNTSNSTLGQVIENRRIVELPLDGREPFSLAGLAAGVIPVPPNTNIHQGGAVPSINGASNFTSEVTIDGVPDTTPRNSGLNNFLIYTPTVDAVSEFKVETNSLSAEYGRFNGGVISVVTKSGSNAIHGSAYEFLRNSALDANNFFNNRSGIPLGSLKRNQYGFTLGGPVVLPKIYNGHDRTFFFVDYEGYRENILAPNSYTVPTDLQRAGDFSQTRNAAGQLITIYDPTMLSAGQLRTAFPGNVIPQSRISQVALALQKYYPEPRNSSLTGNFVNSPAVKYTNDTGDVRVDHNFNDRHRLFGRFSIQYPFTGSPNNYANIATPDNPPLTQRRYAGTAQDTYTFSPTLILNVNYGLARQYGTRTAWSNGFDITSLGFARNYAASQQVPAIPPITIAGVTGLGNGNQNYSAQLNHTMLASLTKVWGSHTIKTGVDFRTYFINQLQNTQASGPLSFGLNFTQGPNPFQASASSGFGYATFLLGIPTGTLAIQPAVASKSAYLAFYAQDDWHVSSKLTVNLGLRYDLNFPRLERYNRVSIFNLNPTSPIAGQVPAYPNLRGAMTFASSDNRAYTGTDTNNFGPRVGLAYQLFRTTTIRAGYGIFYGLSPTDASGPSGGYADGFTGSTSIVASLDGVTPIVTLANPYPNGINQPASGSRLNSSVDLGQSLNSVNIGQATPYVQNWNFSIQHSIGSNLLLQVAYAGSKGTRLAYGSAININALTAAQFGLGSVNSQLVANPFYGVITDPTSSLSKTQVTRGQLLLPYPQYGAMNAVYATIGNSSYHSFQASVEKRFSKGFTLLGAFTASKVIDDTAEAASGQTSGIQDPTNLHAERAIDPQDVSRRLVISGVWELPVGRGRWIGSQMARWEDLIIGGWQLNGISTFSAGQPLIMTSIGVARPNVVGVPQNLSGPVQNRLNKYFDTSAYAVPAAFTYGNSSRTAPNLRAPGIANYDVSIFKNFTVTERLNAQLRFESFNVFNRVQFAAPGTQAGSSSFGVIAAQQNNPRELQIALKLLF